MNSRLVDEFLDFLEVIGTTRREDARRFIQMLLDGAKAEARLEVARAMAERVEWLVAEEVGK